MIYVLSDIHGHYNQYKSIMRRIGLQRDDHLYVLGDCIDRNPFGLKILKELYLMPNAAVLLGNHEYMMLDALTKASPENEYIRRWYRNGGDMIKSKDDIKRKNLVNATLTRSDRARCHSKLAIDSDNCCRTPQTREYLQWLLPRQVQNRLCPPTRFASD